MTDGLIVLFERAKHDLSHKVFDLGDRIAVINRGYNISRNIDDGTILLFDVSKAFYPVLDESDTAILLDEGFCRGTAILQCLKSKTLLENLTLKKRLALEANNTSKVKSLDRQRKKILNKIQGIENYLQFSLK